MRDQTEKKPDCQKLATNEGSVWLLSPLTAGWCNMGHYTYATVWHSLDFLIALTISSSLLAQTPIQSIIRKTFYLFIHASVVPPTGILDAMSINVPRCIKKLIRDIHFPSGGNFLGKSIFSRVRREIVFYQSHHRPHPINNLYKLVHLLFQNKYLCMPNLLDIPFIDVIDLSLSNHPSIANWIKGYSILKPLVIFHFLRYLSFQSMFHHIKYDMTQRAPPLRVEEQ